ncbi:MAG: hypothetical protein STSR0008_06130 [Ignavibacterium sp.]
MLRKIIVFITSIIIININFIFSQPIQSLSSSEIYLKLKKLYVLGNVLYIGAHPDDENTAFLAYCSKEKLVRTAYLSLTRGDGGQNLIGDEQGELLGMIRTEELLQARKIDGAEQYFTRAFDFGFSKNPDETFQFWNKEKILADVVFIIRFFKPDVIVTRFPTTGEGGHGHHTASAILAEEAFRLANDSTKFPEQLKYVSVWQPKRIYWNAWLPILEKKKVDMNKVIKIDLNKYNFILGKSYSEIAAKSRSMHKSQGFGSAASYEENINYFMYIDGEIASSDLFDGIDLSWNRIKGGSKIQKIINEAIQNFNVENPTLVLPLLLNAYEEMQKLEDNYLVQNKIKEIKELILACSGIWIEAISDDYYYTKNDSIKIKFGIINRNNIAVQLQNISFTFDTNSDSTLKLNLEKNTLFKINFYKTFNQNENNKIKYSQPYWLTNEHFMIQKNLAFYNIDDINSLRSPQNIYPFNIVCWLSFNENKNDESNKIINFDVPVLYRSVDPIQGEIYKRINILPKVVINLDNQVNVFSNKERMINVKLKSMSDSINGKLSVEFFGNVINQWKAVPQSIDFKFNKKYDEQIFSFRIIPPNNFSESELKFSAKIGNEIIDLGLIEVVHKYFGDLGNIELSESKTKIVNLNIKKGNEKIGYIVGAGDEIPKYLKQLEYEIQILDDDKLNLEELKKYDVIITGVRAFNTREILKYKMNDLMKYVEEGGRLIVQYNVARGILVDSLGPYPFKLSSNRITDENSKVTINKPEHILLNFPNKITEEDFNSSQRNWIQERGLYFPVDCDSRYDLLFTMNDPDEAHLNTALLFTKYGKGTYIYSSLSLFRQIPAGVSSAYKLLVNLISIR